MKKTMQRLASRVINRLPYSGAIVEWARGYEKLESLNRWQESFCLWNAERLGIPIEESRRRYRRSWEAVWNGHRGKTFRDFCSLSHAVYGVFWDDSPAEALRAYQFHAHMHLLRYLTYPEPRWGADHPIVRRWSGEHRPVILDYGCGLAQASITLAEVLRAAGTEAEVVLADIPTVRKEFLPFHCKRLGVPCTLVDCTPEQTIPSLPPCHVCVATEVFEHLHDPIAVLDAIDKALLPGGFLVTQVKDHKNEMFHVSPALGRLREALRQRGYRGVVEYRLYQKQER